MSSTRRLRLLIYTDSPELGGAELAVKYLLAALSEEIDVAVLATHIHVAHAIAATRAGSSTIAVRSPGEVNDTLALREHLSAVRAFAPDILHANQAWPYACAYGELAGLMTRGTRVLAVDHLPLAVSVPRARALGRRLLARRFDAHVAVGDRCARMVEELHALPRDSVIGVANGVPPREGGSGSSSSNYGSGSSSSASAGAASAPSKAVVIGSLGRLTEQKGYDLLVRALDALPGARLVLVGDGPERSKLERIARESNVAERLTITGWIDDAPSHLGGFDIFALPSRWEGMPLGILEAMQAGLPVIATDVGSVAEVVSDQTSGYLVAPNDLLALQDRLRRLIAEPALRERMGERARAIARERYTDVAMACRYEEVYRGLVNWWTPAQPGSSRSVR